MQFGLWSHCPENVEVAWGARLIVEKNWEYEEWLRRSALPRRKGQHKPKKPSMYTVSMLWDRQSWKGEEQEQAALRDKLNKGVLGAALKEFTKLFDNYTLATDGEETVDFSVDGVRFVGSPRASCGYLYVVAWEERS